MCLERWVRFKQRKGQPDSSQQQAGNAQWDQEAGNPDAHCIACTRNWRERPANQGAQSVSRRGAL